MRKFQLFVIDKNSIGIPFQHSLDLMISNEDKIEYTGKGLEGNSSKVTYQCYFCEEKVSGVIVTSLRLDHRHYPTDSDKFVYWLLCPNCSHGSVFDRDGNVYPTVIEGENVKGLQGVISKAYDEAKKCLSVQAYTACELLCRKLLMYVAVNKGANEGKSFESYIDYLQEQGYITPPMKSWVDLIRQHGNHSTHKIEESNEERAKNTLTFTAMLLKLIYETEHFASKYVPEENTSNDHTK